MGKKIPSPKPKTRKNFNIQPLLAALSLVLGTGLLVIFTNLPSHAVLRNTPEFSISLSPNSQPHPLPPTLAQWQDDFCDGDYFDQVATTPVGYLIWSRFPIRVYIKLPKTLNNTQAQAWVDGVLPAVEEWNNYLPLEITTQPDIADITIVRKAPHLQMSREDHHRRARSAETRYELYTRDNILSHRFTILLSPSQIGVYLLAAARHELGHALGIWGHSSSQTDALYFSQVRNPPPISPRDVNTLKRVYEQPTNLGWSLPTSQ